MPSFREHLSDPVSLYTGEDRSRLGRSMFETRPFRNQGDK